MMAVLRASDAAGLTSRTFAADLLWRLIRRIWQALEAGAKLVFAGLAVRDGGLLPRHPVRLVGKHAAHRRRELRAALGGRCEGLVCGGLQRLGLLYLADA